MASEWLFSVVCISSTYPYGGNAVGRDRHVLESPYCAGTRRPCRGTKSHFELLPLLQKQTLLAIDIRYISVAHSDLVSSWALRMLRAFL